MTEGLCSLKLHRVSQEEVRQEILANREPVDRSWDLSYLAVMEEQFRRLFFNQRDDAISDELMEHRLYDIYIFTGITILTILITLTRSFLFFNVSGALKCGEAGF